MKNSQLLQAAHGEATSRTPVWVMRQAGRILPEYRKIRESVKSFKELVKTPELACEVTLQPVDILGVDAAIIFSDILVVPEAMGLPYEVVESTGPVFERTVENNSDVDQLKIIDAEEDLSYVIDAMKLVKRELNGRIPLIGFAGAPWTIFSYMIEGAGSKTFARARRMLRQNPELSDELLEKITQSTINYLNAQIQAGADIVQLFDSWAGILAPDQYQRFGLKYLGKVCDAITQVPVIVFAKGAYFALRQIAQLNCQVIGLDWNMNIEETRQLAGQQKTLQGNLDPSVLYADYETITKETKKMLDRFGANRHIANLGHGVYPDTDPAKVKCFIDTVKEHKFTTS